MDMLPGTHVLKLQTSCNKTGGELMLSKPVLNPVKEQKWGSKPMVVL